jgi:lysyl-tRNA synthetase class 1
MLPSLRAERATTYSPFLPICPKTGRVLYVPMLAHDVGAGTITYQDEGGAKIEVPVTGGHCKLQWKVDWAMRWVALDVDYEMSGKDLIDSVKLSSRICSILGGEPPDGFNFELFLDEKGEKISKSKGNGLTIDEWLTYALPESLALYMYQKPRQAKRLYFDVIPRAVDDYLSFLDKYPAQTGRERYANPVWHIHKGSPPQESVPLSFGILMNLASVAHTEDKSVMWSYIARYVPGATPANHPILDRLVGYAIAYYRDFVRPTRRFRTPTAQERAGLEELKAALAKFSSNVDAETIQTEVYEIGKRHGFTNLRDWFKALYEVLLGQEQGPRMGSFIALYGVAETVALIDKVLAGQDLSAA